MLDKMETRRGHLGGQVEHLEGKGGESAVAVPWFLCGSPHLCQLRTEGLAPVSKYWTYRSLAGVYGPSDHSNWLLADVWFFPTASLPTVGETLGMDPQIDQSVCCGLCREPFFSGAVDLFKSVDNCVKGCHVRGPPIGSVHRAYVESRGKHTCYVGRVFPYRVYIDSNRRDSQIWVTACSWLPSSSNLLD
jgi:hypothetical protein